MIPTKLYKSCPSRGVAYIDTMPYGHVYMIRDIAVPVTDREQGIATGLMKKLFNLADENRYDLVIEPKPDNPAVFSRADFTHWLERLGFQKVNNQLWKRHYHANKR